MSDFTYVVRADAKAVEVPSPAPGTYRVDVVGSNVPQVPQDFALVVLGAPRV